MNIVILAAGQGKRMRSSLPKVLHPVAGRPMLAHVIAAARAVSSDVANVTVVVGHGAAVVQEAFPAGPGLQLVLQEPQLGTGHAVMQAVPHLDDAAPTLVLYGDVPLITPATLGRLVAAAGDAVGVLTVRLPDPTGYGRIVRDESGVVKAIVEHKDASAEQRLISEGNTGILAVPGKRLGDWLSRLSNSNAQGEYYLTDVIAMAVADGLVVATEQAADEMEVLGANDRIQLSQLERHYQYRAARRLMLQGVTLIDPARFDLRGEVTVGRDVSIDINVILEGQVVLEDGVQIGPNCVIKNSTLRRGAIVKANSHLEGAEVGEGADCGPFARLRPGSVLGAKAHVGNFVELKNAKLGEGAKAGHLSYLGDAEIGARSNIGAGTITCNYDGANKFKTVLGVDVFIGSNSALVAPVTLGNRATTGAGSVITGDVPDNTLAVGRAKQRNIEGWKRPKKQP
jgi:bifunctional UDP-N-acetylglucosamine pyrophosphorylase/glucosamine-1-phosphate N-acetyltransferase